MQGVQGRIAIVGAVLLVAALALLVDRSRSEPPAGNSGTSPAQLTRHSTKTGHFEYVLADGALYVYSIDHGNSLVQTVSLPWIGSAIHGVVASPRTGRLYVAYGQQKPPGGSLLAYDLRTGRALWHRTYSFGIDSMAISPNGRWIYMPAGEGTRDGEWRIIAAAEGAHVVVETPPSGGFRLSVVAGKSAETAGAPASPAAPEARRVEAPVSSQRVETPR